jgi:hypothetical protein
LLVARADDTVAGELVAAALTEIRARLQAADSWTTEADALDADGQRIDNPDVVRSSAVTLSLLGAVEAVTPRVELQAAVARALREALVAAASRYAREHADRCSPLYFMSILYFARASTHAEVLALIDAARALAVTRRWEAGWGPVWPLPSRRMTREEDEQVGAEMQGIDLFFESHPYAGQHSATMTMLDVVIARERALQAACAAYGWVPPLPARIKTAAATRLRRATRGARAALWRPAARPGDDIPF